ncbi:hypothetical protein GUJ93_ZPchr0014g47484 [Zizania palustris]|uniref:Uncharacterized protein n=1 Tax=Zizania palustris TaxID=103762 RepID=A0A8J5TB71_ZIZPA|nr:hypothetical protein GUJ93_ZPchr0014g47484 [Zizania palustris]
MRVVRQGRAPAVGEGKGEVRVGCGAVRRRRAKSEARSPSKLHGCWRDPSVCERLRSRADNVERVVQTACKRRWRMKVAGDALATGGRVETEAAQAAWVRRKKENN